MAAPSDNSGNNSQMMEFDTADVIQEDNTDRSESEETNDTTNPDKHEATEDDQMEEDGDDSDSDSSDSEKDLEVERKITDLTSKLNENPFVYDTHIDLIKLLRQQAELEQLREARQQMHQVFPLSEELWLEWLQDEIKIATAEDRPKIIEYFDRAVADYMSVGVWLEYVQYAIGGMSEEAGIQKTRTVFERAVTAVGLHVTKGALIWEAYREFENAILMGLQPGPGEIATQEQQDQINSQTNRVKILFKRQLAVPLIDMKDTYAEYKEWSDQIDQHIEQSYRKAQETLHYLLPYEDALMTSEPPHLDAYQQYIKCETSRDEPARIQCIYERALQENCLVPELWLKYTNYLDTKLRVGDISLRTYERSVRNCPWCADLWLGYVRAVERHSRPEDIIIGTFEKALNAGFSNGAPDYLRLWTAYCDYMRRRVLWDEDHERELEDLRLLFDRAVAHLAENFGLEGDPNCTLLQYWARLEAKFCKNMEKSRELWNLILQQGFANQAASWLEYLSLERSFGNKKHCRKLLQRAINSVADFPESICEAYINFEREEGTLEHYDQALLKCETQLQRVEERREKAAEKETRLNDQKKKAPVKKSGKKFDNRQQHSNKSQKQDNKSQKKQHKNQVEPQDHPNRNDRKWESPPDEPITGPLQALEELAGGGRAITNQKRKHEEEAPLKTDADGFKVPAPPGTKAKVAKLDGSPTQPPPGYKPKTSTSSPTDPPPGFRPHSHAPPPGFLPKGEEQANTSLKHNTDAGSNLAEQEKGYVDAHHSKNIKDTSEMKHSVPNSKQQCTVFVSNLDYSIKEDKIKALFCEVGDITDIRLVKTFKGQSKGYAYVEFIDEFAAGEARRLDRTLVEGRPMFVSPCEEQGSRHKQFKYSLGLEKNKLFVKGLPYSVTEDSLRNIFSQHGEISSVRLVTYRTGTPKGLAYVTFQNDSDATQAVLKTDGLQVGEHTISVAISNPPERKPQSIQKDSSSFTPTLGSGKKETTQRGKARTQVSLLPRALRKTTAETTPSKPSPTLQTTDSSSNGDKSQAPKGKMSNAEFRSMLLGNR